VISCIVVVSIAYFTDYLVNAGQVSMSHSIIQSANKRFLSIDPIFHTMKKSGLIINKVSRGATSIESLVDITMYNFVPIIVAYTSMTIAFAQFDGFLATLALTFVVVFKSMWFFYFLFVNL
jgi:ABC-type transport system involved in Fe-S cluster assembly fused permease/ATPase subunit